MLVLQPANHNSAVRSYGCWSNNNIQLMVALSPTGGIVEAETDIVGRDEVEPNNTCRGFNNSSCWARWQPSIVLLLHFWINQVKIKEKFE